MSFIILPVETRRNGVCGRAEKLGSEDLKGEGVYFLSEISKSTKA